MLSIFSWKQYLMSDLYHPVIFHANEFFSNFYCTFLFYLCFENVIFALLPRNDLDNLLQVIYSEEERKFNKDITIGLIHSELLNLAEYNVHMAKLIDGGRNSMLTFCIFSLLNVFF